MKKYIIVAISFFKTIKPIKKVRKGLKMYQSGAIINLKDTCITKSSIVNHSVISFNSKKWR